MNVRTGPHGPPPAVVVIPSRWHLEVVMGQLQGLCSLATSTGSMAFALNTSTVFSFCAVQTGTLLHWCIPARGQVTQQIQHACSQHMTVFVFYPSEGCLSNVENMLSYWLGRECVQQMGDSRYLTISQCLVQGTLRSATSSSTEDEPSSSSSSEEDEVMNASFQQESDRHRERAPSPPPAGLTKRLCLTRPCQKASIGQPLCIVCRENVASVVFLDCGHLSACENCICANWKKGTGKLCCYVCRAPSVLGPASVYISEHVVPRL